MRITAPTKHISKPQKILGIEIISCISFMGILWQVSISSPTLPVVFYVRSHAKALAPGNLGTPQHCCPGDRLCRCHCCLKLSDVSAEGTLLNNLKSIGMVASPTKVNSWNACSLCTQNPMRILLLITSAFFFLSILFIKGKPMSLRLRHKDTWYKLKGNLSNEPCI